MASICRAASFQARVLLDDDCDLRVLLGATLVRLAVSQKGRVSEFSGELLEPLFNFLDVPYPFHDLPPFGDSPLAVSCRQKRGALSARLNRLATLRDHGLTARTLLEREGPTQCVIETST